MNKLINVQCSTEIKDILVTAMRNYTDVAFPAGSADCALVARESMLDSIAMIEREYSLSPDGRASYNKRLRAMVKEAIQLYYKLADMGDGYTHASECTLLLEVVSGVAHGDSELAAARAADRRVE